MNLRMTAIFLLLTSLLIQCGSNDDPRNDQSGTASLALNGERFSWDSGVASIDDSNEDVGLSIGVIGPDNFSIILSIPKETNIEENRLYNFDDLEFADCITAVCGGIGINFTSRNIEGLTQTDEESFAITFTEINLELGGRLVGTFAAEVIDFNTDDTYMIANGTFDVPIK